MSEPKDDFSRGYEQAYQDVVVFLARVLGHLVGILQCDEDERAALRLAAKRAMQEGENKRDG